MRAPATLWLAAGTPNPRKKVITGTGRCYWCASPIDGDCCKVADVFSDSFTDQDQALVRSSAVVCCGCAWAMTGRPPDTLRLWSVAWAEEPRSWPANHASAPALGPSIHLQNKADPSGFRALLLDPPTTGRWICAVADSGQIHTTPFAPVNYGAERFGVRFERVTVWTSRAEYGALDAAMAELLSAGFWKSDIESPSAFRLAEPGALPLWLKHRELLGRYRGGPLFDLVLFLSRAPKEK